LVEPVFFRHVFGFFVGFVVAVDCDMYVVWREMFCSAYFIVPDGRVSFVKFLFCVLVMCSVYTTKISAFVGIVQYIY
jgi:hypothetical protein